MYKNDLVAKYIFSLQQVSREEGEETTATTPTLQQRESPDFVSLEEDTKSGLHRWNVGVVYMSQDISFRNIFLSSR